MCFCSRKTNKQIKLGEDLFPQQGVVIWGFKAIFTLQFWSHVMFQTMTIYLCFYLGNDILLQFWTTVPLSSADTVQPPYVLNSFVFICLTWDKRILWQVSVNKNMSDAPNCTKNPGLWIVEVHVITQYFTSLKTAGVCML